MTIVTRVSGCGNRIPETARATAAGRSEIAPIGAV
jgi:hypothetical protein